MYLLDTNACIRIINNTSEALIARLRSHAPSEICLCSVVKAELVYGALRSRRKAENLRLLRRFFEPLASLCFDDSCAEAYGAIRSDLEALGTPIGPNDLMIAAITRTGKCTLVTHNQREFSRVVDLNLEDWEISSDIK